MLLNKTFDRTLIGQNYLSFITGITLLLKKQSVLLLDDKRVAFDSLWGHYLNYLNFQYLQLWGVASDIDELKRINHYLKPVPIKFYTEAGPLYLPGEPFDNLNECLRRFPDIFDTNESERLLNLGRNEFNQTYYQCVEYLAEVSFRFKNLPTMTSSFYGEMKWPYFDQLFEQVNNKYRQLLNSQPKHPFLQFIYLAKSLYHREILFELSPFEVGHLLLCLLGPIYQMKHRKLEEDLQDKFQAIGGHHKQSTINSWQIYQNQLTHIELNSFEGVIAPNQCSFMGLLSPEFPFTNDLNQDGYRGASYKIRGPNSFNLVAGERILYSHPDYLGGDIPLVDLYCSSPQMLNAWIPYRNRLGSKYTFYQKYLDKFLLQALESILVRQIDKSSFDREVEEAKTFWIRRKSMEFEQNYHVRMKQMELKESLGPLAQIKINRFDYWGPLRSYSVGLFSYLLELKDYLYQR